MGVVGFLLVLSDCGWIVLGCEGLWVDSSWLRVVAGESFCLWDARG